LNHASSRLHDWRHVFRYPGIAYVYLGLIMLIITLLWPVLFYWGLPLPRALTARVGGIIGPVIFYFGMRRFITGTMTERFASSSIRSFLLFWRALLILCFFYGVYAGNDILAAVREIIVLWLFAEIFLAGTNPLFWHAIAPALTFAFYIATPLLLMYYDVPGITTDEMGSDFRNTAEIGGRFTWSLVYGIRSLTATGIFLAFWAVILNPPQSKYMRYLQLAAPFFQFFFTVVLFQFRGGAFIFILITVIFFLIRPLLDKQKVRNTALLFTSGLIGLMFYLQSDAFDVLQYRAFEATQKIGIFESRSSEFKDFVNDMGFEMVLGRGLGGTFDASNTFGAKRDNAHQWGTLHIGLAIFLLKGGIPLLIGFLYLCIPTQIFSYFRTRNRYQLIAILYYSIILFSFIMNPFSLSPTSIFPYIPIFMMLGVLHSGNPMYVARSRNKTISQKSKILGRT